MKMKKQIWLYVVLVCMIFSGCGKKTNADSSQEEVKNSVTSEQSETLGFTADELEQKIDEQPFYPAGILLSDMDRETTEDEVVYTGDSGEFTCTMKLKDGMVETVTIYGTKWMEDEEMTSFAAMALNLMAILDLDDMEYLFEELDLNEGTYDIFQADGAVGSYTYAISSTESKFIVTAK